ncbi:hypothetical protein LRP52_37475 [Photobacterium sp. ZSDE20]|uniref:Uncharacterized protein n=1 Tax=Photobacterium pectinilyticum TaxID=2906793 RepID=A0ABT1N6W1_9GAMM|nr:hypothetical protein [Photobacterium sp. ZSDE20]MCQ1060480.1 hypothetical protein [Photobacterium sp. ZSDE20]MDD1827880.1 hypothetical protein [Photobacterium sp. ZSDE20]
MPLLSKVTPFSLLLSAALTLTGCNADSQHDDDDDSLHPDIGTGVCSSPSIEALQQPLDIHFDDWRFDAGNADWVATAQVAGKYAAANSKTLSIELRDINQRIETTITADRIMQSVPDVILTSDSQICAMSLTPSGRFLYFTVCGDDQDAIFAYNTNTDSLSLFDQRILSSQRQQRLGMTYFQGQLFVGSDKGVYRYDADRNAVYDGAGRGNGELITTDSAVTGLAVDMLEATLYATTSTGLYRFSPQENTVNQISDITEIEAITLGRVYGAENSGGLYLLQCKADDKEQRLWHVGLNELRDTDKVTPQLYHREVDTALSDISATADGRMMLAQSNVKMMFELGDQRLSYDDWLLNELDSYKQAIFSLVEGGGIPGTGNQHDKPGMLLRKISAFDKNPNKTPIADNVGWALFLLMAIDQVAPDPDIEKVIELLIRTHAGLTPGHGGERTVDGHFIRVYRNDGTVDGESNPNTGQLRSQPQVYVSMKFLPAAIKAAELYPDNANLQQYQEYLRQLFKRSSDVVAAQQRITWTNDDHGPVPTGAKGTNLMANETWIFGDIAAAQDPYVTSDYARYTYDRESFKIDDYLKGEPVIKASQSAFIIMGATMILNHHYYDDGWKEQNRNYYGLTMAETDDMGVPYFAAFSAGNHPPCPTGDENWCGTYYNDGPSDHPNDILHFPAVLGFGQHQLTAPVVGGYMAYRDGRRQAMNNASGGESIEMLTRWSMALDDFTMDSVGIADFWYGGVGLAEAIAPGTIDKLRGDFYRPYVQEQDGKLIFSNMTPRRVIGIDSNGQRTDYGYQIAPFSLPRNHSHYEVIDPEGDWIELEDTIAELEGRTKQFTNPTFLRNLQGWQKVGGGNAEVVSGFTGKAVQLTAQGETYVNQPLDVSLALTDSRYLVEVIASGDGNGALRLRWRADKDMNSALLKEESVDITGSNPQPLRLKSHKPDGANYLHIEYVATEGSVMFENTAVMLRGADSPIENGGFDQGFSHWSPGDGVDIIDAPELATSGTKVLEFFRGAGVMRSASVGRNFDISSDPIGTRYLFRFDYDATQVEDVQFTGHIEVLDEDGERVVLRQDIVDLTPGSQGERTFTIRKRPTDTHFLLTLEMKQLDANAPAARIFIDNFRLDKERLFHPSDCVMDSPSGCLPSQHK